MAKEKRQSPSTLLWFIRHKSYVPISEIRRRFPMDEEEGCFIDAGPGRRVFIGLSEGTAQSVEKLWQQGKIGYEYSVEFDASVLIGVYPMNPSKDDMNGYSRGYMGNVRRPMAPIDAVSADIPHIPPAEELVDKPA